VAAKADVSNQKSRDRASDATNRSPDAARWLQPVRLRRVQAIGHRRQREARHRSIPGDSKYGSVRYISYGFLFNHQETKLDEIRHTVKHRRRSCMRDFQPAEDKYSKLAGHKPGCASI
jgi:hypothetical protein